MKRDIAIAVITAVVVAVLCFGLAIIKPDFMPTRSHPATDLGAKNTDKVVMRVNGDPVTEIEFQAAFSQLPEEMQRQFASEQGKSAFAEQLVRLKLLEQQAKKLGVESDPKVAAQLSADRTNILAGAVAQKLVQQPTPQAVQKFYDENKGRFQTVELSHILIAYQGGMAPAKNGGQPPSQQVAVAKAATIYQQLKKGADFAALARQVSDDTASAERGGALGTFGPGMLPQELDARIMQMPEGSISDPIPSRFGVHIFKAGRRSAAPIDQVRQQIVRRVQQQNTLDRVELMRKNAKVDFDPKFFPEAAAAQKPPVKKPS